MGELLANHHPFNNYGHAYIVKLSQEVERGCFNNNALEILTNGNNCNFGRGDTLYAADDCFGGGPGHYCFTHTKKTSPLPGDAGWYIYGGPFPGKASP